jgi:hypothetical protein
MNDIVKLKWQALDGRLVFDFAISRELRGVPSQVAITCKSSPGETRNATVTASAVALDITFPCGCYVRGSMRRYSPVYIDGVLQIAIFSSLQYGAGPGDDHRFEGVMVACPESGPLPPPAPPMPPMPPFPPAPDSPDG